MLQQKRRLGRGSTSSALGASAFFLCLFGPSVGIAEDATASGADRRAIAFQAAPYAMVGNGGFQLGADGQARIRSVLVGGFYEADILSRKYFQRGVGALLGYRVLDGDGPILDVWAVLGRHHYQNASDTSLYPGVDGDATFAGVRAAYMTHTDGTSRLYFGGMLSIGSDLTRRDATKHLDYGPGAPLDVHGTIGQWEVGGALRIAGDFGF